LLFKVSALLVALINLRAINTFFEAVEYIEILHKKENMKMATGYLRVTAAYENAALPISGTTVKIFSKNPSEMIYQTATDTDGQTDYMPLTAPEVAETFDSSQIAPAYSLYDVEVSLDGFNTVYIHDVEILGNTRSTLPVALLPLIQENRESQTHIIYHQHLHPVEDEDTINSDDPLNDIEITPHGLRIDNHTPLVSADIGGVKDVYIPTNITVHLGTPSNTAARNVTIPFAEYIANVASSEIYATWPQESLYANIYAITTFAINRIYTEWYRGRGYNFDITNNTAYDQYFVYGRNIYDNLQEIANAVFDMYVRRQGYKNPLFTQYCNGTRVTCNGLSQWGTVTLANQGMTAEQILRYYYGNDIEIVESNNIHAIQETFPGTALQQGQQSDHVRLMQQYLNRIRLNYPAINAITSPNGYFGSDTTSAVKTFQKVFGLTQDGIIGRSTWNKISQIYVSVVKLAELTSEGERIGIGTTPPTTTIRQGSTGENVRLLQYIINYLSEFYNTIPSVTEDGKFGNGTANAVKEFQRNFGLTADSIVGPTTWKKLYDAYTAIHNNINVPLPAPSGDIQNYPGVVLNVGAKGSNVGYIQNALNSIAAQYTKIPIVTVDNSYGPATAAQVQAFQEQFNLTPDGIVGKLTWDSINSTLTAMGTNPDNGGTNTKPAYPGYPIRFGSRGDNVTYIQQALQKLSARYPAISNPGKADGIFGTATDASVRAFQRYFSLTADGVVGQQTWNMLNRQLTNIGA
jgi:peptidoglycan hydrolase-like protein with peptidoglycan-binding domain